eukprot:m.30942 g.30942  ORF g.30942 m.30942 type:complete len:325 (+) comp31418_c0_seq3:350-1324(+)
MPLLNKKPFVQSAPPADLNPDEEIFVCKATNEVFRDYEDFFQRTVQCDSQIWTCEYSGRASLTYSACLTSEREALELLDSFPDPLKRPVLSLIHHVRRAGVHHIVEDVISFFRDRFVEGETVNVSYAGRKTQARVVSSVITDHTYDADTTGMGSGSADSKADVVSVMYKYQPAVVGPNTALYIYHLEYMSPNEAQMMPTMLPGKFLSRKKSTFTREKTKLFLKLCLSKQGGTDKMPWIVRPHLVSKYRLEDQPSHGYYMMVNPVVVEQPIKPSPSRQPKSRASAPSPKSGLMIPVVRGLVTTSGKRMDVDDSRWVCGPLLTNDR